MSIRVTDELVARVALLSRLHLSEEEAREMEDHFRKVLGYVSELQELDTSGVDPSVFSLDASNVLREDEPSGGLSNDEALAAAPQSEPPYFLVPRIVGGSPEPAGGASGSGSP